MCRQLQEMFEQNYKIFFNFILQLMLNVNSTLGARRRCRHFSRLIQGQSWPQLLNRNAVFDHFGLEHLEQVVVGLRDSSQLVSQILNLLVLLCQEFFDASAHGCRLDVGDFQHFTQQ